MGLDADDLLERWILAFCEPPPVLDPELMIRLLAEHETKREAER